MVTAQAKAARVCDDCRYDGGWHYDEAGNATRCGNYVSAQLVEQAHELSALAHEQAMRAAKEIITDAARSMPVFSANCIREALDAAQIPGPVVGAAFRALAQQKQPVIARTDERVQSNETTTRHEIYKWRSLIIRKRAAS
jgi:hypothetical protein